jgi:hypothetical protein
METLHEDETHTAEEATASTDPNTMAKSTTISPSPSNDDFEQQFHDAVHTQSQSHSHSNSQNQSLAQSLVLSQTISPTPSQYQSYPASRALSPFISAAEQHQIAEGQSGVEDDVDTPTTSHAAISTTLSTHAAVTHPSTLSMTGAGHRIAPLPEASAVPGAIDAGGAGVAGGMQTMPRMILTPPAQHTRGVPGPQYELERSPFLTDDEIEADETSDNEDDDGNEGAEGERGDGGGSDRALGKVGTIESSGSRDSELSRNSTHE